MKVLQLHNRYRVPGGEDAVVKRERDLLERHGHRVITMERANDEMDGWPAWRRALLPATTMFSLRSYRAVRALCRRERPDVAHVHNVFFLLSPSVYHALDAEGVPIVQTCHNFRFLCANAIFFTGGQLCERCKGGNYFHAVVHRCYRDSRAQSLMLALTLAAHRYIGRWWETIDAFIALSEFSQCKLIEGGLPVERMFLKPHFLDNPPAPCFESDDYAVLMGRLHQEKDVATAVEAFRDVRGLRLLVLGNGPLRGELEARARQAGLGHVEFRGFIAGEPRFDLVRRARMLLLPSRVYENFAVSVLEAYAMGKAVVASRIGAIAELVEDGVTGLLFEPGNAADLAEKVNRLRADPALAVALGRNARRRFEERFNADANYQQLMEIYRFARQRRGLES
ncbi:MAG: glycosyltransferase family 4 protein [Verrucomicrobia bacterium]|nr:glycosyltransferase family 4 protein [Verrucomicrobiota bacterium]